MTPEQKEQLEQAYEFHAKEGTVIRENDALDTFMTGAQTILDNPGGWGLADIRNFNLAVDTATALKGGIGVLKGENHRLREALERVSKIIDFTNGAPALIAVRHANELIKEALKQ